MIIHDYDFVLDYVFKVRLFANLYSRFLTLLQEKIRDLGRRVVSCPVLEAEVKKLRMNLQTLEERLNSVRREQWARYLRDPVKTYIQRFQLYEYEIDYLSQA
ncbi:hypothetical protein Glove_108g49 [Diversispora epigaea]|uniref:Uncharacterized protein n=1 Tax=Diversispora epigaea TaxID=1348612 RepID=A0A397JD58_9GLOM|nr:hypothetical protein Glove_108g49 [Diversispora epigaea]